MYDNEEFVYLSAYLNKLKLINWLNILFWTFTGYFICIDQNTVLHKEYMNTASSFSIANGCKIHNEQKLRLLIKRDHYLTGSAFSQTW